jgi:alkanesulfonate monooxygenase SsuD/methylene tetrahydromethanopterin reductase-like flavin-dependent oxidoreductase (luciferase family)
MHPWVTARQSSINFGLQVFALPEEPEPTERVLRAGRLADELGFDAFFIGDHPGYQTEPWIHLGALAATTTKIGLGSVVNCLGHRQPALYGRLAGDLDRISHGRAILGLGIGWNLSEFKQLGLEFPSVKTRQEALDEALQIIDSMFGSAPIDFHGRHYWVEGAHFQRGSVQKPRPPILVAGAGEQVTLRQVARFADACNFGAGSNVGKVTENDGVKAKLAVLRGHCEEIGRPYDDILRTHFTSWAMLSPTEAGARAKLDRYYPQGLTPEQKITRIVGTPERVAEHYQGLVEAGMQYFVIQVLDAADEETFTLLATDVLPRLRPAD